MDLLIAILFIVFRLMSERGAEKSAREEAEKIAEQRRKRRNGAV